MTSHNIGLDCSKRLWHFTYIFKLRYFLVPVSLKLTSLSYCINTIFNAKVKGLFVLTPVKVSAQKQMNGKFGILCNNVSCYALVFQRGFYTTGSCNKFEVLSES